MDLHTRDICIIIGGLHCLSFFSFFHSNIMKYELRQCVFDAHYATESS